MTGWLGAAWENSLASVCNFPGLKPACPAMQADSLPLNHLGSPKRSMRVSAVQSCPTLCNSMNCSPPGSSVHGILQARTLEWVAIPFSKGRIKDTKFLYSHYQCWASMPSNSSLNDQTAFPCKQKKIQVQKKKSIRKIVIGRRNTFNNSLFILP